jgi:hypothetical protein
MINFLHVTLQLKGKAREKTSKSNDKVIIRLQGKARGKNPWHYLLKSF